MPPAVQYNDVHFINTQEDITGLPFTLYPNPAKTELNISFEASNGSAFYRILNLHGELLGENKFGTQNIAAIDIGHLNAGLYLLEVRLQDQYYYIKFLKN